MTVPAVAVGGAFVLGLSTRLATPYHCVFLVNEGSTPFVNMHFFLTKAGNRGPLYKANGFMMWLAFLLFRIVANVYLWVRVRAVTLT